MDDDTRNTTPSDEWAALSEGCGHPDHGLSIHLAVEADFVGEILRGAGLLTTGWAQYLEHSDPGLGGHSRVMMAFHALLTACADRLQPPRPAPAAPAPTTERRLTVVSPARPDGRAG